MKKITFFLMLIAFIVLFSGCKNKDDSKNQPSQESTQQKATKDEDADKESKITGSLKDLLGMGKNLKCTTSSKNDKYTISSATYVSGKKVRSDVSSQISGAAEINSHVIILDNWTYAWNDKSNTGTKFDASKLNRNNPEAENGNQGSEIPPANDQLENKSDFNCLPWTVDDSLFALPSNINFIDQTELISNTESNIQPMQKSTCEICDTIPNVEAKEQCKSTCDQQKQ